MNEAFWTMRLARSNVKRLTDSMAPAALIFDLDGVLVSTSEQHFQAWSRLAGELDLPFDRQFNEEFRGVARMACLLKLLGAGPRRFSWPELEALAERKNRYFLELIADLAPRDLPTSTGELLETLQRRGIPMGVVSSSRNARMILARLEIADYFRIIVDGQMVQASKPDPEGFLLAARHLKVLPNACLVFEDASAGIHAALAAGMMTVAIAPGGTPLCQQAHWAAADLSHVSWTGIQRWWRQSARSYGSLG